MNYKHLKEQALEIATKAHLGQLRRDGTAAITHPVRVSRILAEDTLQLGIWTNKWPRAMDARHWAKLDCLALLHDVREDNPAFGALSQEEFVGLFRFTNSSDQGFISNLWHELVLLTRPSGMLYVNYIERICNSWDASKVKLADLQDNLAGAPYPATRDKYHFAANRILGFNVWAETKNENC